MKEFNVNSHVLSRVECDVPLCYCPVYYKVLFYKALQGNASLKHNTETDVVANVKVSGNARDLKNEIMNLCMECNVKAK